MATQTQVREIRIKIDTQGDQGLRRISNQLGRVSKDVNTTARSVTFLRNAFSSLAGISIAGFGLRSLAQASDEIQLLRDRIAVFEGSTEAANTTIQKLVDISARTAAPLATTALSYNRLALALDDVGIRGDALLQVVETLQNTFRLGGATIAETRGALIQLSQGLASGELRGQELRSVLEANAIAGEILAKKLSEIEGRPIGRGDLIRLSEKRGGISASEVISALADSAQELEDRAANLSLTIEQSLALAFNKFQVGLLKVNDTFKLTEKFTVGLNFAVVNLETGLIALAAVLITLKLPAIIAGFSALAGGIAFVASQVGILAGSAGFKALAIAGGLAAIKFVVLAGGIALVVKALTDLKGLQQSVFSLGAIVEGASSKIAKFFASKIKNETISNALTNFSVRAEQRRANLVERSAKVAEERAVDRKNALMEEAKALAEREQQERLQLRTIQDINILYDQGVISLEKYNKELLRIRQEEIQTSFTKGTTDLKAREEALKKLLNPTKSVADQIKELNAEFTRTGDLESYNRKLRDIEFSQLSKQLEEGTANIEDFNQKTRDLNIRELNTLVAGGVLSFEQYNTALENVRIDQLDEQWRSGTLSLEEYNKQLNEVSDKFNPNSAIFQGLNDYIRSSGTLATNIAGGIEKAFGRLEDSLFDFIKTGRFEFAKFTQAILDDLTRIIIRAAIVQPLARGLLGAFGGAGANLSFASAPGVTAQAAKGKVFDSQGITAFARGGIVNGPTTFPYNGGTGLMGEAGPEAIVPLRRTSSGDLGIQAVSPVVAVNIINNANVEVEARETTGEDGQRAIEVLIVGKVKEAIGNGAFDKQFATQYGVRRRGV